MTSTPLLAGRLASRRCRNTNAGKCTQKPRHSIASLPHLELSLSSYGANRFVRFECVAFQKPSSLSKKEQEQLESLVAELLEKRLSLQERIGELESLELPIQDVPVNNLDAAEAAAIALRQRWGLGTEPITNLLDVLEAQHIHIIEVDAGEGFDGISAVARDAEGRALAATTATRRGTSGDRHSPQCCPRTRTSDAEALARRLMRKKPLSDSAPRFSHQPRICIASWVRSNDASGITISFTSSGITELAYRRYFFDSGI